jgi:hypothetical protein
VPPINDRFSAESYKLQRPPSGCVVLDSNRALPITLG